MITIGSKIVFGSNFGSPADWRHGTVTKESRDYFWVDNQHKPEDCIYRIYCVPEDRWYDLCEHITETERLQKEVNARQGWVYEYFNNLKRLKEI